MHELKGAICYMAGPIDYSKDLGVGFRQEIISRSEENDFGIIFLDPTNKISSLNEDVGKEQNKILQFKKNKDYKKLKDLMKGIIRSDLRCIDYSDFVILYIDPDIHMCGSYHEMLEALGQKKPILTIVKGGVQRASSWLFGLLDTELMFNDIDSLINYLKNIETSSDDRWVLFRKEIFEKQKDIFANIQGEYINGTNETTV